MNRIDLNELWIGDEVVLLKSNRKGFFQGFKNGKIRVKVNGSIIRTSIDNIALAPPASDNVLLDELTEETHKNSPSLIQQQQSFNPSIDLHMDKLQPSKQYDLPVAIIEFQIRKLKEFMEKAIHLKCPKVTIIHGKGTGALKMETENLIQSYEEYLSTYPINDGGGMIVYLNVNPR